jgi:hypothetical protein
MLREDVSDQDQSALVLKDTQLMDIHALTAQETKLLPMPTLDVFH